MSNTSKREFRVNAQQFDVDTTGATPSISGYAARFNEQSHVIVDEKRRMFNEVIAPGAFTKVLSTNPDVQALVDHDKGKLLGRTSSGTLSLTQDDKGLAFRCDLPDTSYARDLAALMQRGDIKGCSFGMYVRNDDWSKPDSRGVQLRTLKEISLFEITVTPNPAYPTSSVELRSLFPDGVPTDVVEHRSVTPEVPVDVFETGAQDCVCTCPECVAGNCDECSDENCDCEGCTCEDAEDSTVSESERNIMAMRLALASL